MARRVVFTPGGARARVQGYVPEGASARIRLNFGRLGSPVSASTCARQKSERPKFRNIGRSLSFTLSSHDGRSVRQSDPAFPAFAVALMHAFSPAQAFGEAIPDGPKMGTAPSP
jgi:hypothetical protein